MSEEVEFNSKPLDNLIKALKDNKVTVRVGILGGKNARSDSGSNATIGAAHEFGAPARNLPIRSFLRMPIETQFHKGLEKAGGLDEKAINQVLKDGTLDNFANKIGIQAVATILQAFDTGGFGTWPALNPKTLEKKKIKQILVETHQLRDSITYDVKKAK